MSVLETARLRLRPFHMDDLERAHQQFDLHPDMWKYDPGYPPGIDHRRRWLIYRIREFEEHGYGCWAIDLASTGELIGACGLDRGRREDGRLRSVEVYYRVGRDYWGQGFATEAVSEVVRFAFDELGVDKVVAHADGENEPSIALLTRVGFSVSTDPVRPSNVQAVLLADGYPNQLAGS